nr:L-threonylcarbamoyladenylate synthase [Burkholderiaceae bacterium]
LARSARAHDLVTGGQDSVGLRCPSHPWARALLQAFGDAVAAPSANRFGRISPTTAQHVRDDLGERSAATPDGAVDLILDGGACPVGIESTIVDFSHQNSAGPTLLRPGSITRAQLEAVLGVPVPDAGAAAPRASGRLDSHYAPRTPLELVEAGQLPARINALRAQPVAVLAPAAALIDRADHVVLRLIAPPDAATYAQQLYASLHRLDAAGADRILVARPPEAPDWLAIHDRLRRAQSR